MKERRYLEMKFSKDSTSSCSVGLPERPFRAKERRVVHRCLSFQKLWSAYPHAFAGSARLSGRLCDNSQTEAKGGPIRAMREHLFSGHLTRRTRSTLSTPALAVVTVQIRINGGLLTQQAPRRRPRAGCFSVSSAVGVTTVSSGGIIEFLLRAASSTGGPYLGDSLLHGRWCAKEPTLCVRVSRGTKSRRPSCPVVVVVAER